MAATEASKKAAALKEQATKETAEAEVAIKAAKDATALAKKEQAEAEEAAAAAKVAAEEAQAAAEAQNVHNAESAADEGELVYKNVSEANIFTENGRVMPNCVISLTEEQGAQYKGLELCQKPESE